MSFFEKEFPRKLGYGLSGGASFNTTINQGFSGFEQRNRNWAKARNKWTVSVVSQQNANTSVVTDFDLLRNWHLVVGGQADLFRLYEPTDHSINHLTSGVLGTGDGANHVFQLAKTYTMGSRSYVRNIVKPITSSVTDYLGNMLSDTIVMYLNNVAQLPSTWAVDYTTGLVTFVTAPTLGVSVSADCDFHFPVRFNSDDFMGVVQESNAAGGYAIVGVTMELMEVRI